MKRLFLGLVLIAIVSSLTMVGCAAPTQAPTPQPAPTPAPAPVKALELRLSNSTAPMHVQHKDVLVPWAAEVEKRTQGRIKVTVYPAQQLGTMF